jgi:hypothetical protein
MRKILRSRVAAVSIGALVVVGLGAGGATAAGMIGSDEIRNNSIQQEDLGRNSVGASELRDNTVGPRYLTDGLLAQIAKGGKDGVDGTNGVDGKSAYEVAVAKGFTGTEEEWVASLKGEKGTDGSNGAPGKDGVSGYEVRTYDYIAGGARENHDGVGVDYTGAGDGSIATVACSDPSKVALGGGVQFSGLHGGSMVTDGQQAVAESWSLVDSFPGRMDWSTNTPKPGRLDGWIVRLNSAENAPSTDVTVWVTCANVAG